jgi:hypothetical protein
MFLANFGISSRHAHAGETRRDRLEVRFFFGSKVSMCDGPPSSQNRITDVAFAFGAGAASR